MANGGAWKNRIVGHSDVDPSSLLANECNWRIHTQEQQAALQESLEIGWVQDVIVNKRSSQDWGKDQGIETVLDGHARVKLALRHGETSVPVKYVDLGPIEELQILAALDRITGMAGQDDAMLVEIIKTVMDGGQTVPGISDSDIKKYLSEGTRIQQQSSAILRNPGDDTTGFVRPQFDGVIEEFQKPEGETGKSQKDGNWFYVEFYQQDELYAELCKRMEAGLHTVHQIKPDFFLDILKRAGL